MSEEVGKLWWMLHTLRLYTDIQILMVSNRTLKKKITSNIEDLIQGLVQYFILLRP